jgi:hypothetical protein
MGTRFTSADRLALLELIGSGSATSFRYAKRRGDISCHRPASPVAPLLVGSPPRARPTPMSCCTVPECGGTERLARDQVAIAAAPLASRLSGLAGRRRSRRLPGPAASHGFKVDGERRAGAAKQPERHRPTSGTQVRIAYCHPATSPGLPCSSEDGSRIGSASVRAQPCTANFISDWKRSRRLRTRTKSRW